MRVDNVVLVETRILRETFAAAVDGAHVGFLTCQQGKGMFVCSAVSSLSVGPLKALYTSPHVHSDTNSTSLGSIQPCCNYCPKNIHSYIFTTVNSQVLINIAE